LAPNVNQILYLQVNSIDESEAKEMYKSRISDVDDQYITMEVPMNEKTGRLKRLYAGDEISAHYVSEGGVKNYFNTAVLGFKEDVVRLVVIKRPDPEAITKVQRRNFLRVPAELEIAVRLSQYIQFTDFTDDVSGGGISFLCDKHIPAQVGNQAECWMLVTYRNGRLDHIQFNGELIRVKPLETTKQLCMLRFTEITDMDRQKIVRYCFERQMDFRKK
jgi:c-di-GMP-binding flagellar brake protein YcgR